MKFSGNDFQYGQERVKQLMGAAVVSCLLAVLCNFSPALQIGLTMLTLAAAVWAFVIIFRYCKCPSCGKQIAFGVLALKTCPKCKRSLISGNKIKKSKR